MWSQNSKIIQKSTQNLAKIPKTQVFTSKTIGVQTFTLI